MVVQKTIWPNLGYALQRAVLVCRCSIHSESGTGRSYSALTRHYPTTSTAAVAYMGEWSIFPCFC